MKQWRLSLRSFGLICDKGYKNYRRFCSLGIDRLDETPRFAETTILLNIAMISEVVVGLVIIDVVLVS